MLVQLIDGYFGVCRLDYDCACVIVIVIVVGR